MLDRVHLRKASKAKRGDQSFSESITVADIKNAERKIVKAVQARAFPHEITLLQSCNSKKTERDTEEKETDGERQQTVRMKKTSPLYRLGPFLDESGILRVGGRIRQASISLEVKHPIILPRNGHVTKLIIKHFHEKTEHQGRGFTLNEIRSSGYWIVGCSAAVANYIRNCVTCQRLRATTQVQRMADLPVDRIEPAPPFAYCGVDYFGPWLIKQVRKEVKRYGVLFTCMTSRAIHLEVAHTLEADSFLNALRRFTWRRGPVRQLRSDRGTNFIGARREFREALSEIDKNKVKNEMLNMNCDWIEMKFNVPSASHMGGVWERQIKTVRGVLSVLLEKNGTQLNDEALHTLMCEAAALVNSRPLTTDNTTSPDLLQPLTPNHLLTQKSKVVLPQPGVFQTSDLYSRKQWRRVQHLTNEFWVRSRKEFLHSLQERSKWAATKRNLGVGDIVLIKEEEAPRNQWKLARVEETY